MELWEGAILVVGGIFLVGYMSRKNALAAQSGAGSLSLATTVTPAGTSNASNLTNLTNTAGGYPTIMGEPLEPPQPPISPVKTSFPIFSQMPANPAPVKGTVATSPIRYNAPISERIPVNTIPGGFSGAMPIYERPMQMHL
jgi:hypothetical protein